jgi:hypothetical protein
MEDVTNLVLSLSADDSRAIMKQCFGINAGLR